MKDCTHESEKVIDPSNGLSLIRFDPDLIHQSQDFLFVWIGKGPPNCDNIPWMAIFDINYIYCDVTGHMHTFMNYVKITTTI